MKKARKLKGFDEISIKEKEKIRETLEQQTKLFYRDLNKLKRQVVIQIEEISRKRVNKIASDLKDVTNHHPDFKLADVINLLNDKILEET